MRHRCRLTACTADPSDGEFRNQEDIFSNEKSRLVREVSRANYLNEASGQPLLAAVIDRPGDLALEVFAAHDAIDVAVLQQELAGLEAFG